MRLKPDNEREQRLRQKELFIYFYLYYLESSHKELIKLEQILDLVIKLRIRILLYFTPINCKAAIECVGNDFKTTLRKNVLTVKQAIESKGGMFIGEDDEGEDLPEGKHIFCFDWSELFNPSFFFHHQSMNEHLNEKGRMRIADRFGDLIQKSIYPNKF